MSATDQPDGQDPVAEQQRLLQEIGTLLFAALPAEAARLSYKASALTGFSEAVTQIEYPEGLTESIKTPPGVTDLVVDDLRAVMYREGAGTWFSTSLTVSAAGALDADFNYDDEPQWRAPIKAFYYVADAERYPRSASATPSWLSQILASAGKQ